MLGVEAASALSWMTMHHIFKAAQRIHYSSKTSVLHT